VAVGQVVCFLRTGLETWIRGMIMPDLLIFDDDKEEVNVSSLQLFTNVSDPPALYSCRSVVDTISKHQTNQFAVHVEHQDLLILTFRRSDHARRSSSDLLPHGSCRAMRPRGYMGCHPRKRTSPPCAKALVDPGRLAGLMMIESPSFRSRS
jgi:hypothetical protein